MSRLLPDTQLLVWLAERPGLVPQRAMEELQREENEIWFSLVSIWEVSIKSALNRADFTTDPRALRDGLLKIGFRELSILPEHVLRVSRMPALHGDPFDRLLVAQAEQESLTLITVDKKLAQYGPHVWRV